MDKIKFAQLISYITMLVNNNHAVLSPHHLEEIEGLTRPNPMFDSNSISIPAEKLNVFLTAMKEVSNGKKIEAIKEYRVLTGVGLKEAKDAVEKYMCINANH